MAWKNGLEIFDLRAFWTIPNGKTCIPKKKFWGLPSSGWFLSYKKTSSQ